MEQAKVKTHTTRNLLIGIAAFLFIASTIFISLMITGKKNLLSRKLQGWRRATGPGSGNVPIAAGTGLSAPYRSCNGTFYNELHYTGRRRSFSAIQFVSVVPIRLKKHPELHLLHHCGAEYHKSQKRAIDGKNALLYLTTPTYYLCVNWVLIRLSVSLDTPR